MKQNDLVFCDTIGSWATVREVSACGKEALIRYDDGSVGWTSVRGLSADAPVAEINRLRDLFANFLAKLENNRDTAAVAKSTLAELNDA